MDIVVDASRYVHPLYSVIFILITQVIHCFTLRYVLRTLSVSYFKDVYIYIIPHPHTLEL